MRDTRQVVTEIEGLDPSQIDLDASITLLLAADLLDGGDGSERLLMQLKRLQSHRDKNVGRLATEAHSLLESQVDLPIFR